VRRQWFAKRTPCNRGTSHPSIGEARRCDELQLMEKAGAIRDLEEHPSWSLDIGGVHVGRYTADWRYRDARGGGLVVEDFKGARQSRDVTLRIKLLEALHGIKVLVTGPAATRRRRGQDNRRG
jgi:hypothetical protein